MTDTPSDPYERFLDGLGRPFRRFALVVVAVLIVVTLGALLIYAETPAIAYWTGIPLLVIACICPELVFGMIRHELNGTPAAWDQLTSSGRVARVAMTALGTALLTAPFVGIGWWMLR
jgi:hypothetical protein